MASALGHLYRLVFAHRSPCLVAFEAELLPIWTVASVAVESAFCDGTRDAGRGTREKWKGEAPAEPKTAQSRLKPSNWVESLGLRVQRKNLTRYSQIFSCQPVSAGFIIVATEFVRWANLVR